MQYVEILHFAFNVLGESDSKIGDTKNINLAIQQYSLLRLEYIKTYPFWDIYIPDIKPFNLDRYLTPTQLESVKMMVYNLALQLAHYYKIFDNKELSTFAHKYYLKFASLHLRESKKEEQVQDEDQARLSTELETLARKLKECNDSNKTRALYIQRLENDNEKLRKQKQEPIKKVEEKPPESPPPEEVIPESKIGKLDKELAPKYKTFTNGTLDTYEKQLITEDIERTIALFDFINGKIEQEKLLEDVDPDKKQDVKNLLSSIKEIEEILDLIEKIKNKEVNIQNLNYSIEKINQYGLFIDKIKSRLEKEAKQIKEGKKTANIKTLDDVIGMEDVKQKLLRMAKSTSGDVPMLRGSVRPRAFLLSGPPGVGKTFITNALANSLNMQFLSLSGADFSTKYIGGGVEIVEEVFNKARQNQPCIIFIDEMDSIGSREANVHEETKKVINKFLVEISKTLDRGDQEKIILMGATNYPENLDQAFKDRFKYEIFIAPMNDKEKRIYLETLALSFDLDPEAYDFVLHMVENGLVPYTSKRQIQKIFDGANDNASEHEHSKVLVSDIEEAIREIHNTTYQHTQAKRVEAHEKYLEWYRLREHGLKPRTGKPPTPMPPSEVTRAMTPLTLSIRDIQSGVELKEKAKSEADIKQAVGEVIKSTGMQEKQEQLSAKQEQQQTAVQMLKGEMQKIAQDTILIKEKQLKLETDLENTKSALELEKATQEQKLKELNTKLATATSENKALIETEIKQVQTQIDTQDAKIKENAEAIIRLKQEIMVELSKVKIQIQNEKATQEQKLKELNTKLATATSENKALIETEIRQVQDRVDAQIKEIEDLKAKEEEEKEAIKKVIESINEKLLSTIKELEERLKSVSNKEEIEEIKKKIEESKEKLVDSKNPVERYSQFFKAKYAFLKDIYPNSYKNIVNELTKRGLISTNLSNLNGQRVEDITIALKDIDKWSVKTGDIGGFVFEYHGNLWSSYLHPTDDSWIWGGSIYKPRRTTKTPGDYGGLHIHDNTCYYSKYLNPNYGADCSRTWTDNYLYLDDGKCHGERDIRTNNDAIVNLGERPWNKDRFWLDKNSEFWKTNNWLKP